MSQTPAIDPDIRAAAEHGSWCPKLCNHACPVLAATGRNEAVPWGFHRTVTDLASGRTSPEAAAPHLADCSGCLGCRTPCTFDQDVPAQVRAGRAAVAIAGAALPALGPAREAVAAGASPYGAAAPQLPVDPDRADLQVVVGCRDDADTVAAAARLYAAAGVQAAFVASAGCCGATLRDLGAPALADGLSSDLRARLGGPVVALDPHCLTELHEVEAVHVLVSLHALLDAGQLTFVTGAAGAVTYHDPCLLARAPQPVVDAPRALLAAAGYDVVEPEGTGAGTVCSGAGMAYDLVDPAAAEDVAARRRTQLAATQQQAATACSGARRRLATDDAPVRDLLALLADRLPRNPT